MLCWARERRAHVLLVQFKELRTAVGNTLSTTLATFRRIIEFSFNFLGFEVTLTSEDIKEASVKN